MMGPAPGCTGLPMRRFQMQFTQGPAMIYAARKLPTLTMVAEESPFQLTTIGVYRPPHISPRIPAQRSVFTVHPEPTQDFGLSSLNRWKIRRTACSEIKRVLDACAINEAS